MLGQGNKITYPKTLRPHHNKGPETPGWLSGPSVSICGSGYLLCVRHCWPQTTLVGGFSANWARRIGGSSWWDQPFWLSDKLWKEKRKKKGKGPLFPLFFQKPSGVQHLTLRYRGQESDHRPSNWWPQSDETMRPESHTLHVTSDLRFSLPIVSRLPSD